MSDPAWVRALTHLVRHLCASPVVHCGYLAQGMQDEGILVLQRRHHKTAHDGSIVSLGKTAWPESIVVTCGFSRSVGLAQDYNGWHYTLMSAVVFCPKMQ